MIRNVTDGSRVGVGSLFFLDRILRFGENMPQSLKGFLSNFNVMAIQNSLDAFRNTLYVRNDCDNEYIGQATPIECQCAHVSKVHQVSNQNLQSF